VLYEIVTGTVPYGELHDAEAILDRARVGDTIPIEQAAEDLGVPKSILGIINKAIAAKPEDRFQTVLELQDEVRAFVHGGFHLPQRVFEPGSLLMREGDMGDTAYMIVSGHCRAFRTVDGQQETLAQMQSGDVFGEMALLLAEPRAASVEAVDRVTVMVLDKNTMTEGLGIGGWTGSLVRAPAQRFRDLEQHVRDSGMRRS
jgi:serine/threonine-protein kinase